MKKTVLITNSSREIGKATAIYFAEQGWNVAAAMDNPEKGKDLLQFKNIKVYELNLQDNNIKDVIEQILLDFSQLDVLIHNVCLGDTSFFENLPLEYIKEKFACNVFGLMNVVKEVFPHFRSRKTGQLITILPTINAIELPFHTLYNSIFKTIHGFSESISEEVFPFGIRLKIFDLPLLQSDFYESSQAEKQNTQKSDDDFYQKNQEKFQQFLQKPNSIDSIPSQIYQFVEHDTSFVKPIHASKIENETLNLKKKISLTLQKMIKKK
jgi:short-subunit dehydrogenase